MKTFNNIPVSITLMILALVSIAHANDGKFEQVMKKQIEAVYKAESIDEYQQAVNAFQRIGMAEKARWEPLYYIAFGYVMMANVATDKIKKDTYLDEALTAVNKAAKIEQNNSEVVALEGFIHMIRVTVDPASRGPEYVGKAMQQFGHALKLNPENPRALALMAQMQLGTAQFFGTSSDEACQNNLKALEKFDTFKSENQLAPQWGRPMAEALRGNCK